LATGLPLSCFPFFGMSRSNLSGLDIGHRRHQPHAVATTETEGISVEELQLAARNHALPLEALRHDITPVGLHYLLIHFDIPAIDAGAWRLEVGGLVARPLALSLVELK